MLNCARCQRLVVICSRCDRGQRYCSASCAQVQRRRSVREAGRRYQRTPLGARNNAARQKRWRIRIATTVTHHTSPAQNHLREEPPSQNVKKEAGDATTNRRPITTRLGEPGPRCDFCGRPCGSYTRMGTLSTERRRGWRVSRRL
jgi:hypothetical protein